MNTEAEQPEASALRRALALDSNELTFLRGAALPARLAALAMGQVGAAQPKPVGLWWVLLPVALVYGAWLVVAPIAADTVDLLAQAGGSALVASLAVDAFVGTIDWVAGLVEVASGLPGFDAPLVTLSLLAAALYAGLLLTPQRGVRQLGSAV